MTWPEELQLEGRLVRLRRFTQADITDAYIGWLNDVEVTRFSNQRFRTHDRDSAMRYLQSFELSPNLFISIRCKKDDAAIGTMTVYAAPQHGTADVGIMVGARSVWGTGHGQDAWSILVDWLAKRVRKVTAGTLACNVPMIRLADRSGMIQEATRRDQELVDGRPYDILYFAHFSGR